jgi:DNA-directed RNA polymerase II subunit RPB2
MPNGENLIVAVCSYTGYNQEDSIIFNKDAIDRGMFNITYYKSFISTEQDDDPSSSDRTLFANPLEMQKAGKNISIKQQANFDKLDVNGFPKLNEYISDKDAIVGKCKVQRQTKKNEEGGGIFADQEYNETYVSACDIADKTVNGHVDKVYVYEKPGDGQRVVKIKLRKFRIPEFGDKAASAHGQKGVCGMILPSESMPFTKEGLVPDIIINPHAFPTRMTVGHLLECLITKACVIEGTSVDVTPFEENETKPFNDVLENAGFQAHGDEILYNGITGEQIHTDIFFGPTYYHRLKHMVADKINYRTQGKKVGLTMQPTKGRSNEGGLRIGEMEANALVSHGVAAFTKESFMERSDKHSFIVDNETGAISSIDEHKQVFNGVKSYSKVELPFSFKLMTQELNAMSLMPRLITDDDGIDLIEETYEDDLESEGGFESDE